MATSAEGIEVRVPVPAAEQVKQRGAKAPATLQQSEIQAAAAAASSPQRGAHSQGNGWPAALLWVLFIVGWVFPPCWWIVVASGLKTGSDSQFLIKRRKNLSSSQSAAWWASVLMSVVSALVLILVLAVYFGRKSTAQEGEGIVCTVEGCAGQDRLKSKVWHSRNSCTLLLSFQLCTGLCLCDGFRLMQIDTRPVTDLLAPTQLCRFSTH